MKKNGVSEFFKSLWVHTGAVLELGDSDRSKYDLEFLFFENISKTMAATVVQSFGILEGAPVLLIEIWPIFLSM